MNGVVIVAAGTGSRMNMGINKQFIKLEGKEIIAYTIEKFYNNSNIEDIVGVVKEDESEFFKKDRTHHTPVLFPQLPSNFSPRAESHPEYFPPESVRFHRFSPRTSCRQQVKSPARSPVFLLPVHAVPPC